MTTIESMTRAAKGLINFRIDQISDSNIKWLLSKYFDNRVPEYFWLVAASQSGQYHPIFAKAVSGLVRHTCAAFDLALEIRRSELYCLSDCEWDTILAALLVHDTFKLGYIDKAVTRTGHPSIAADEFYDYWVQTTKNKNLNSSEDACCVSTIINICNAVESHQGKWGRTQPVSNVEKIVHLCDLLSSKTVMEQFYDIKESDIKSDL